MKDIERIKETEGFKKMQIRIDNICSTFADGVGLDIHHIKFMNYNRISLLIFIENFETLEYVIGEVHEGYLRISINKKAPKELADSKRAISKNI